MAKPGGLINKPFAWLKSPKRKGIKSNYHPTEVDAMDTRKVKRKKQHG